jgi:hypothetical protein
MVERSGILHLSWMMKAIITSLAHVGPRVTLSEHEAEEVSLEDQVQLQVVSSNSNQKPSQMPPRIPNFLLHVMDPNHVPPHEVALQLCQLIQHTRDPKLLHQMNQILYKD